MEQLTQYANSLEELLKRDVRYPLQAYGFMLNALHYALGRLEKPRHMTGQELAEGFRQYAVEQFGPMAMTVMEAWNLRSTEDLGSLVFNLIDVGLLTKTPEDRPEDFYQVYSFQEAFGGPYQYLPE